MQNVISLEIRSLSILKVELLNNLRYSTHVVVTVFVAHQALISHLSMFAVLGIASACLSDLRAFGIYSLANLPLILNYAGLYAFD